MKYMVYKCVYYCDTHRPLAATYILRVRTQQVGVICYCHIITYTWSFLWHLKTCFSFSGVWFFLYLVSMTYTYTPLRAGYPWGSVRELKYLNPKPHKGILHRVILYTTYCIHMHEYTNIYTYHSSHTHTHTHTHTQPHIHTHTHTHTNTHTHTYTHTHKDTLELHSLKLVDLPRHIT
jgi:hypothetical protein